MIASLDKNPVSGEPPSLFAILAARARQRIGCDARGTRGSWAASPSWRSSRCGRGGGCTRCFPSWRGAFGLWGILERGISERGANRSARYDRVVAAMQWLAVAIGTVAAIVTAFAVLGILLGTFIS